MAIKKIKVQVTRTDEYVVEIDEAIYNEEWREKFATVFWPLESTEDIAQDLAQKQMISGQGFWEGYGFVKQDGRLWFPIHAQKATEGLNVRVISKEDYEFDIEEIIESEVQN
jgi:hypothetical protein